MNTKRLYLVVLMLVIIGQQVCSGQNKPPAPAGGSPAKAQLDPQLEVNRVALLGGNLLVADVMLFHEDPNARKILLEILEQSENSPARIVVCRALIKARADKKVVKNVQEFIDPLLVVFSSENGDEARLAAEATLIFEYAQISRSFEKLLGDTSKPVRAKVNTVRALKLRLLDMNATIKLITLVDDSDKQVAAEAEKALRSLGIDPGENADARKQIRQRIIQQGRELFLENRLIHVEKGKNRVAAELVNLETSYLTLLGTAYKGKNDDVEKGKFLAEHLAGSKASVRLWALGEVDQWRKGTNNPTFPGELLEPILISLISDPDKDVRLRTADLLTRMVELNSARPLLSQLEVEQDDQVKTELFVALGWACSFAISSTEPGKISSEIKEVRAQTLKWAEKFLSEKEDAEKVRSGAEVVEKLLKRDGLEDNEEKKYLDLLLSRYEQEKNKSGGTLRGKLLSAMAGLCTQNSTCRDQAAGLYKSLFEKALLDDTAFVRETAVDGLGNIDKTKALEILRDRVNDPSDILRKKIIAFADAVGDKRDLQWLAEKIGVNSESKPAWQAMGKIFSGSDADTINEWVDRLTAGASKLTNEQKIDFLLSAGEKASGQNKPQMLKGIRERLIALYLKTDQHDKAVEYLDKVWATAATPEEKNAAVADLVGVYFAWPKTPNTDLLAKLLAKALEKEDLDADGTLLKALDEHLAKPAQGVDPNAVINQLAKIQTPKERPKWGKWLKDWQTRLSKIAQPADKPQAKSK
ncbi:MAG: HEAT repeat domain-containing protein [Planctomycetota bacterium]|nr:HEAT repeat domain-containing protein [Planctomycetota bacterium]